jgi:hypothetical protein
MIEYAVVLSFLGESLSERKISIAVSATVVGIIVTILALNLLKI